MMIKTRFLSWQLLNGMGRRHDVDHPPTLTRAMIYENDPEAEWVTEEIVITVRA
jgi:2-phospho-L-lactate guanylyltransferase (CobY/MobA/RfbA family)